MMREFHKSKYTQAIPGVNRIDDNVHLTHAERCVSHFGDGLPMPERLLADAANAHQRGRHTKVWCENMDKIAEGDIREASRRRDDKVRQWKEHLNQEVDKLAKEIEEVEQSERDMHRKRQYFSDLMRVSEMTSDFRKRIPDKDPDDKIDQLQREEMAAAHKADSDIQQCSKELKECRRQLEAARSALMSEVEAKAFALNISRRCQHSEPLLSFPYIPADHPVDQIYHPNTEEDWEKDLDAKLQNAIAVRQEASTSRLRSGVVVKDDLSCTADAWYRTSKAIQEEVQRDERTLHNIQKLLEEIEKDVQCTKQRVASLCDDLRIQDRGKTLQLWRLQTLTFRPGPDHIRDAPVKKCEEELCNIEKKSAFVGEGADRNRALLGRLQDEKARQGLLLQKVTKKLFIERTNCLGLRRTVSVEGRGLDDYVTAL